MQYVRYGERAADPGTSWTVGCGPNNKSRATFIIVLCESVRNKQEEGLKYKVSQPSHRHVILSGPDHAAIPVRLHPMRLFRTLLKQAAFSGCGNATHLGLSLWKEVLSGLLVSSKIAKDCFCLPRQHIPHDS